MFGGGFGLYAMEQEGLLDTRESRIQKMIKELRRVGITQDTLEAAADHAGFGDYELTQSEVNRIVHEASH